MAKVPNGVETLLKNSIARVGRTNVTDRRQTDGRRHIANVNAKTVATVGLQRQTRCLLPYFAILNCFKFSSSFFNTLEIHKFPVSLLL